MSSREVAPVSVVIPNYNGARLLEACLASLERQALRPLEILVVDNASLDNSIEIVRRLAPEAILLPQTKNLGFAAGVNAAIRVARGEWIAVLNNDAEVAEDWLAESMAALERHPDAAFIACRILEFQDRGRLYSAGDCFLRAGLGYRRGQELRDGARYQQELPVFSACGCAAIYRKSVLREVGGYDEKFFAYLEDVDLGLRLQAGGHQGYYAPRARVYHRGGGTSGGEFSALAVRLRTRNALFLIFQGLPAPIIWRCLPRIIVAQAAWFGRVAARARFGSYLRGLAEAFCLLPAALKQRSKMRRLWRAYPDRLWHAILRSEALASEDFSSERREYNSTFLKWYFRLL